MEEYFEFPVLDPELQVSFYFRLKAIREEYLHEALKKTIKELDIEKIDIELNRFVPKKHLKRLALFGLRGEVLFPIPYIIKSNPFMLGYYRLLLGFSQKEFYSKRPFSKFKHLEDKGKIPEKSLNQIEPLCRSLIQSACMLLKEMDEFSLTTISDLQILTIGPQLRGSKNNEFGKVATLKTFDLIKSIVRPYITKTTPNSIILKNDSGRTVRIEFSADPDIQIIEELNSSQRGLISIEIKGGTDASNIHNRIGEAEKSHQKAKSRNYHEFMTILRVEIDYAVLKQESPTTSHFFHLDKISQKGDSEFETFKDILSSILSINV